MAERVTPRNRNHDDRIGLALPAADKSLLFAVAAENNLTASHLARAAVRSFLDGDEQSRRERIAKWLGLVR